MKCCRRTNIYTAVQFKPGMEDGFALDLWEGSRIYCAKGDNEPNPLTVAYRTPYINMPFDREPGFACGYAPKLMHEDSWILTDWNGCIQIWNDKDFRVHFAPIEESKM